MKELKKLKLSKFTSELQKGQMRKLMGGSFHGFVRIYDFPDKAG